MWWSGLHAQQWVGSHNNITFRAKAKLRLIYSSEEGLLLQMPQSV